MTNNYQGSEKWTARDYLCHHGIIGQKWGVRRFQNPDGTLTAEGKKRYSTDADKLRGTKTYNLDKWGKAPDTNVLYVTGYSGSGKSTVAENLRDKNTDVIHLDFYFEKGDAGETRKYQSREFNKFMSEKGIQYSNLTNGKLGSKQDRWKLIDQVAAAINDYGKQQFSNGKRVVCEGVQIADDTLYPESAHSFYKGKPVAIMETSSIGSTIRGMKRDDIPIYDIPTVAIRLKNQRMWSKKIKDLKTNYLI